MLKLKLQYSGHLIRRVDSLEKTLMMGGIWGRRRRGRQDEMAGWHHGLDGRESLNSGSWGWTGRPGMLRLMESCLTLCNPIGHHLPGYSVHEIFQARILGWVAVPSSRRSF